MIVMQWHDWLALLAQFMLLSLLSVSGAITTVPDMHRYLVDRHQWLTDAQFTSSIAIAQAAPGPNVLFVGLMGWNVGLNAGGGIGGGLHAWMLGVLGLALTMLGILVLGLALTMLGILVPSTTLTWFATRWAHRNRAKRGVRAFKQGMAPIVVGLLVATGWVLAAGNTSGQAPAWHLYLVTLASALVVWRTRIHLLWLLGVGAALGAAGFV